MSTIPDVDATLEPPVKFTCHYIGEARPMRMGLREANQKFSKAIREVKAGREVVLTERGKPFAVIKPLPSRKTFAAAVARMIAEGRLVGPLHPKPVRRGGWTPPVNRGRPLSELMREDRDAGW